MTTDTRRDDLLAHAAECRLSLRQEPSGWRHYLDGRPVHAGDHLELLLADGRWALGRYEWCFEADRPPLFFLALEDGSSLRCDLTGHYRLRWPA